MREKRHNKTILFGSITFVSIVGIMLFLLFSRGDIGSVFSSVANAKKGYLLISVGLTSCFIVCEAINILRVLKSLGYKSTFWQNLKYSAVGLFFSDITPSASGGQPMQLYFMHRDGIHVSHGMISLLAEALSYQIVNCSLGVLGLIYSSNYVNGIGSAVKLVLLAGLGVNMCALILLLLVLFSPKAVALFNKIANKIIKNEKRRERLQEQIAEYAAGSRYLKENSGIIVKNLLTSIVQFVALYSIPYCVYLSLGLSGHTWIDLLMMQALLNAGASAIPLPGTVGIGETGFKVLFADIFIGSALVPGMIMCRGIGLYLGLFIALAIMLIAFLIARVRAARECRLQIPRR